MWHDTPPNSRSYISHFTQPDTIVPDLNNPQAWDRYAYALNNPIRYNDPSGHCPICLTGVIGGAIGGIVGAVGYTAYVAATGKEFNSTHFWIATGGGAAAGALIGTGVGFAAGVGVAEATTAAVGVGEAANVACGGDMCASEAQQLGQTAQEALPVVENAATQVGDDLASAIKFDPVQVQEKFKHAIDFGINGNYSLDNASRFVDAMKQHVNSAGTQVIQGTYRTTIQTINYFNQGTGLNVFTDTENNFISGWKLSVQQAYYLLQKGNLK